MNPTAVASSSGLKKAAILLVLLGEEASGHVYRNLPEQDLQKLTDQIAKLEYISPDSALSVLEEYQRLAMTQDYVAQGGTEYAHKLLVNAFGEEGAKELLNQVARLESLQKIDPQQLAKFLENEHPQTIALVMAHLDAKSASELLLRMSEDVRATTIKRLAQLRQFSPDVAQKVSLVLHQRLESIGEQSRRAYAGVKGVADLLNRLDPPVGKAILENIEHEDPQLALSIRNLMFTFEDLLSVPEQGLRELLGQLDKKTLALALRGASDELKSYFFKAMSSRAVEMLKEDMEVLGPVRSREVIKAQQEIVAIARTMESEGRLSLGNEGEDEVIV
ncbi:MAG: flagellar motor switch protein FliG [Acidobacteria bacterium]|nr:MAG: flagellar motor switch protein FliG [Acidobacteriota bacterium]